MAASKPLPCLFFGTFNPIHLGHLVLAETARCHFNFQQVLFIPAGNPPHRQADSDMAPALDRLKMVQLAIASNPSFAVSEIEVEKPSLSYTIETLETLFPEALASGERLPLIMGADALQNLGTWHRAADLAKVCWFLQAARPAYDLVESVVLSGTDTRLPIQSSLLPNPEIAISASQVRQRVRDHQSIRYQVPATVRHYIEANQLYRKPL